MMRPWLPVLVLLAGGCVSQPKLRLAAGVSDRPRPLWEIHFTGNRRFSDDQIRAKLASAVTDYRTVRYFDPEIFQEDLRRIEALYRAHGYYAARVADQQYYEWEGRQVVAVVRIEEGPVVKLASVSVRGAPDPSYKEGLGLAVNRAFEHDRYLAAKDELGARLRQSGYAHAEISGSAVVDTAKLTADVTFIIRPGSIGEIGEVGVLGPQDKPLAKEDENVVRSLLTFRRGQRYSDDEFEETEQRLYETGAFERVEIDPALDGGGRVIPIIVRTTLGRTRQLRLGIGVGSDQNQQEMRTSFSWLDRNFRGGLKSLEIYGRLAYAWLPSVFSPDIHGVASEVGVRSGQPSRTAYKLDFTEGLAVDTQLVDEYRSYGIRPAVAVAKRWWRFKNKLTVGLGYTSEARFFDFFTTVPETLALEVGVQDRFFLSYFEPSLVYDTRADPLDPNSGVFLSLVTAHAAGGTYGFDRVVPEVRGYVPVIGGGRWLTVSGRLRVGYIRQRQSSDELVHVSQRFFAGGASSHRGFGFRRLSPRVLVTNEDGEPDDFLVGGETLVESSFELRSTPWRFLMGGTPAGFGGVVFLDAGRVGRESEGKGSFAPERLEFALGWGLRLDTIAGPLRFDVGYRVGDLDKNGLGPEQPAGSPPGEPKVAVHFSFGQAF